MNVAGTNVLWRSMAAAGAREGNKDLQCQRNSLKQKVTCHLRKWLAIRGSLCKSTLYSFYKVLLLGKLKSNKINARERLYNLLNPMQLVGLYYFKCSTCTIYWNDTKAIQVKEIKSTIFTLQISVVNIILYFTY